MNFRKYKHKKEGNYFVCGLIYDVINYCARIFDMCT